MPGDAQPPPPHPGIPPDRSARETRWAGEGYADITKLRELSAKHERRGARIHARIARIQTKIEKIRHSATLLREKAQKVLARIPEFEQEMSQYERNIKAALDHQHGHTILGGLENVVAANAGEQAAADKSDGSERID